MEKKRAAKVPGVSESDSQTAGVERVGRLRDKPIVNARDGILAFMDDDGSLVEPHSQVRRIIDEMVETGFFGDSQALCVERIVCRWILDNSELLERLGIRIPRLSSAIGVQRAGNTKP